MDVDFWREWFPLLFIYLFFLFMVCPSESLNILECILWGYYSWCDKLPVGSGCGLSTIGDFPSILVEVQYLLLSYWANQSLAVSWPLSLIWFCIQPHWCFSLGLCLIVSVSIFILSPNFNFIWFAHDFNILPFVANFSLALCW